MNIKQMVISAMLKKGVLYEAENCELEFEVPMDGEEGQQKNVKISIKADNMMLKIVND